MEENYFEESGYFEEPLDSKPFDSTYEASEHKEDDKLWQESKFELRKLLSTDWRSETLEKDPLSSTDENVEKKSPVVYNNGWYVCQICFDMYRKLTSFCNHYRKHGATVRQQYSSPSEECRVLCNKIETAKMNKIAKPVPAKKCAKKIRISAPPKVIKEKKAPTIYENGWYICQICFSKYRLLKSFHNHYRKHSRLHRQQFLSPFENVLRNGIDIGIKNKIAKSMPPRRCLKNKIRRPVTKLTFKCIQCSQKFSRPCKLKRHLQTEHGISEYSHRTIKDRRPIQIDDFGGEFQCSYCPSSYTRKTDQRNHEILCHTGETPFVCEFCSCSFSMLKSLKYHYGRFHKQVSVELRKISLEKIEVSVLSSDQNTCADKKPEIQSSANKSKRKDSSSTNNSKINSNSSLCEKSTNEKLPPISTNTHVSSTNESSKFRFSKSSVKKVTIVYADESYCSYCPKSFASKLGKELHERIHNGDTPYLCKYCEVTFRLKKMLISHMRRWHPGKPYNSRAVWTCQFCKLSFASKKMLENHRNEVHQTNESFDTQSRSEEGSKFVCDICYSRFKLKHRLVFHRKKIHPVIVQDVLKENHIEGVTSYDESDERIVENEAVEEIPESKTDEDEIPLKISSSDELTEEKNYQGNDKVIQQKENYEIPQQNYNAKQKFDQMPEHDAHDDEQLWSEFIIIDDD